MIFSDNGFEKYKEEVKEKWGNTEAYTQYEEKAGKFSKSKQNAMAEEMDGIMSEFASCLKNGETPSSDAARCLVKKLQAYITKNYYNCTDEILAGLGQMYVSDDRFKSNIDRHAEGTAEFICKTIENYYYNQLSTL